MVGGTGPFPENRILLSQIQVSSSIYSILVSSVVAVALSLITMNLDNNMGRGNEGSGKEEGTRTQLSHSFFGGAVSSGTNLESLGPSFVTHAFADVELAAGGA